VASCLRPNAAAAPANSGLLELGSNSTGGVQLGSNRGMLDLAGAPGTSRLVVQCRRCPCKLRFAQIRLEFHRWGADGNELWHA